ncbi:hypothetical protein [Aureibacillus halotolerans]|uniref:Uncharacterized protein n=1 Tax=Aureibacillus halotolerans TaxID=1508390 RepID=A0A4R6U3X0_9BACI|nr:hypothetical protein [Aureibacillus halotolerans]TDQ41188.1 hypothetical protein EV213_104186 [Aureibacillus halotolerans]
MNKQKKLPTFLWWIHGIIRFILAIALLYNGAIKLGLGQYGMPDLGDALIAHGEMSPMGLLGRMVAFSPLFQILAGVAEVGAAVALLWRRTVAIGAMISLASMSFVFVLNLGYDMPGKQISLALLIFSAIVLLPWTKRIATAFIGQEQISSAPTPSMFTSSKISRITRIAGPITGFVILAVVGWLAFSSQPSLTINESVPAGVWMVVEDTEEPAAHLSEDTRWQKIAFGNVEKLGKASVQVRIANGTLLEGTYERIGEDTVQLNLRELRMPGQTVKEYNSSPVQTVELTVQEESDDTLRLSGNGMEMVVRAAPNARLLYDRGFHWGIRPDDPFDR